MTVAGSKAHRFRQLIVERRLGVPLAITGLALLLSFWQRPAQAWSDTRIELLTEPGLFLSRAASLWTPTIDLGHIQSSQFVGYLFPMGPFFALGHAVGIPMWIVQRLWIGVLLAVAGWGIVRLVQLIARRAPWSAGLVAGALYVSSPYVLISLNRGTTWLLPYALLPWMLIWTQRGVRDPKSWASPAVLAILVAAAGGGLNAAVLAWLLVGVALMAMFEAITSVGWRAVVQWGWRTVLFCALLSLWWVVPVLAQVRYGTDYLTFTEHPEAILNTPSASESLRLLGYWVGYINGYPDQDPQLPAIGAYLLSAPTILATFLVPGLAIAGAAAFRRWRYGAFFALLLAFSIFVMSAGFPPGSRISEAVTDIYYGAGPLQFIRTTYKAAPLAAVSIVVLAGVLIGVALDRLAHTRLKLNGRSLSSRPVLVIVAVAVAALVVLWGRPLWAGNAVDQRLFFADVPPAWTEAIADAEKTTPPDTRVTVLPGELFAWYRWAGTSNSVAPALSDRPVAIRQITRPAPPLSAELLDAIDSTLQQGRLTPGQLPPLLRLMGTGRVLVGTDSSPQRNEALGPALTRLYLSDQPGFGKPAAKFGPELTFSPPANRDGPTVTLAQVLAYAAPRPARPKITRLAPRAGATVLDGDSQGIVSMAAVGALDPLRATFYAGDQNRGSLRSLLADRPTLAFTDSNRRRFRLNSKIGLAMSQTLPASQQIERTFPNYDPFPGTGSGEQTVAVYSGLRSLTSPAGPGFTVFPEHRPYAALDGNIDTAWIAQSDEPADRYIDLQLRRPVSPRFIYVRPHRDRATQTRSVQLSVNGGPYRTFDLSPGFNRLPVGTGPVSSLRLRVGSRRTYYGLAPAGLDEVKIPGLTVREALRLPTRLAGLSSESDLHQVPMRVVLERATADFPRRSGEAIGPAFALDPTDAVDAEPGMRRIITLPAARGFEAITGWGSARPAARDSSIDRLVGMGGSSSYESSTRLEGIPGYRASSAFDGSTSTSWRAEFDPDEQPWIEWSGQQDITIKRLRVREVPGNRRFLHPSRVFVSTENGGFPARIGRGGLVVLPAPVSGRRLRVQVTGVRAVGRRPKGEALPGAIAISGIDTGGAIPLATPPRTGSFDSGCGAVTVKAASGTAQLRASGDVRDLDRAAAIRLRPCPGGNVALKRGASLLSAQPGPVFAPDHLLLDGPAPASVAAAGSPAARGGWLVLGQSFSSGWRASCRSADGGRRSLGNPVLIDGFANGWRTGPDGCADPRFAFAPQKAANLSYAISLLAFVGVIALLFVCWRWRSRQSGGEVAIERRDEVEVSAATGAQPEVEIHTGDREPGAGEAEGAPGKLQRVATWLIGASALLVAALGAVYVSNPDPSRQGINFDYAVHQTGAHWIAVVAMVLLLAGAAIRLGHWAKLRR
jgi:arabinofuranan 3-O-arabinosyltransferase